ncbi:MAG: stage II sporulation protein P [Clostridia bacterium]|nr:stage II sporulation protein P [Clostridia bacterium]
MPSDIVFSSSEESFDFTAVKLAAIPVSVSKTNKASISPSKNKYAQPSPAPEEEHTFSSDPAIVQDTLQIKNSPGYTFDTNALLEKPFPLTNDAPKVLIVHTHTSEAYTPSEEFNYTASDAYRIEDPALNICRVGQELASVLEKNGVSAIHNTTSHDYPSYSGCYGRSLQTIEKELSDHPSIQIVIDLHRDAIQGSDGTYLKTLAKIDGQNTAQALVVIGTDAGGLPHPNWQENLSLGLKLQKKLCTMYPGLARPLHLRTERFNGHASPGSLLIEIGSNGNTMEEALACARLVGNVLSSLIADLSS